MSGSSLWSIELYFAKAPGILIPSMLLWSGSQSSSNLLNLDIELVFVADSDALVLQSVVNHPSCRSCIHPRFKDYYILSLKKVHLSFWSESVFKWFRLYKAMSLSCLVEKWSLWTEVRYGGAKSRFSMRCSHNNAPLIVMDVAHISLILSWQPG